MLAQRFSRLRESPVRYALDPAQGQAVYNWLMLHSRVADLAGRANSPHTRNLLGNDHPLGVGMVQQIGQGDHEAAAALSDLMEDHGAVPFPKQGGSMLFRSLQHIRTMLNHEGTGQPYPTLLRGYSSPALEQYGDEHSDVLRRVAQLLGQVRRSIPKGDQRNDTLGLMGDHLRTGASGILPHAYDALHRIAADDSATADARAGARLHQPATLDALRHMNNALSDFGITGKMPPSLFTAFHGGQ